MTEEEFKQRKAQEIAKKRFLAIAPALEDGLHPSERRQIIRSIASESRISERTIYRLLSKYRKGQYEALKPYSRSVTGIICSAIPGHVLEYALKLKTELPTRSAPQIVATMISLGVIADGDVALSTLRRYLCRMKSVWQVRPKTQGIGSRAFQMLRCNYLWQSDIKESREIRVIIDSIAQKRSHVYLVFFIDDKSRLICHGQWYLQQQTTEVLDSFRQAIEKYGVPRNIYTDHGSQYVSGRFGTVCAQLGVRHKKATVGNPAAKGKIERLNRTVEEFIQEMCLEKPRTLEELNHHFRVWVDEYNNRVHSSLDGLSPLAAFNLDKSPRKNIDYATLRDKFKAIEWRKVLKNGCVKIAGRQFDVGNEYIGQRLQFRWEELNTESVELWKGDIFIKNIFPLIIGEQNHNFFKSMDDIPAVASSTTQSSSVVKAWQKNRDERMVNRYGSYKFSEGNNGDSHAD